MSPAAEVDALVIGAGVAGLAAARELERRGAEVVLVESSDTPGGVMQTDCVDGYRLERGPNSVLLRAPLLRGLERFGALAELEQAAPASRARFLLRGGELVPVPLGPLDLVRTPLLSGAGKRRLLREPFVAQGDGREETVAEFAGRRLGEEAVTGLVGPFLTGVYAGDERRLSAQSVFPSLVEAEQRHGSIVRGLLANALGRGERGRSGTFSARGGLGALSAELAAGLQQAPRYGHRVERIGRERDGFEVEVTREADSERWRARRVVVAAPASVAAALLRPFEPRASDWMDSVVYAPVATVCLGASAQALRQPVSGFGFLVPRGEGEALLGCLFMSELFADRAPPGRSLLHCILGGVRAPEVLDLDDAELSERAVSELERPRGVQGDLDSLRVLRWPRAVAQPAPGHVKALARVRAQLAEHGPIVIAGGYTDGVSVADSFASGLRAADDLTS